MKFFVAFLGLISFSMTFIGPAIALLFSGWLLALQVGIASFLIFLWCYILDKVFIND